jgi:hypothetical protein
MPAYDYLGARKRAKELRDRMSQHLGLSFKLKLELSHAWEQAPAPLHQLKRRMLHAMLEPASNGQMFKRLCGASNNAEQLAWETDYPLLLFPCLFEELAEEIRASQAWPA